jgi:hypothetical protein
MLTSNSLSNIPARNRSARSRRYSGSNANASSPRSCRSYRCEGSRGWLRHGEEALVRFERACREHAAGLAAGARPRRSANRRSSGCRHRDCLDRRRPQRRAFVRRASRRRFSFRDRFRYEKVHRNAVRRHARATRGRSRRPDRTVSTRGCASAPYSRDVTSRSRTSRLGAPAGPWITRRRFGRACSNRRSACRTPRVPAAGRPVATVPGHDADGDPVANSTLAALTGAGAVDSTTDDMLLFARANLDDSTGPLAPAMQLAHRPLRDADGGRRILANAFLDSVDALGFHALDPRVPAPLPARLTRPSSRGTRKLTSAAIVNLTTVP